jgi:hypothetical protein
VTAAAVVSAGGGGAGRAGGGRAEEAAAPEHEEEEERQPRGDRAAAIRRWSARCAPAAEARAEEVGRAREPGSPERVKKKRESG